MAKRYIIKYDVSLSHNSTRAAERITYKLAMLAYRCLHGLAPAYLADDLRPVTDLPGRRRLRSASSLAVTVPSTPSGQLVIVLFQQLRHGHGTLCRRKSRLRERYQHLNPN